MVRNRPSHSEITSHCRSYSPHSLSSWNINDAGRGERLATLHKTFRQESLVITARSAEKLILRDGSLVATRLAGREVAVARSPGYTSSTTGDNSWCAWSGECVSAGLQSRLGFGEVLLVVPSSRQRNVYQNEDVNREHVRYQAEQFRLDSGYIH